MSRVASVEADERAICIRQLTVDEGIRSSACRAAELRVETSEGVA
jgi:hypothetical protein